MGNMYMHLRIHSASNDSSKTGEDWTKGFFFFKMLMCDHKENVIAAARHRHTGGEP